MATKGVRDFLNTPAGKAVAGLAVLLGGVIAFNSFRSSFGASDAARLSQGDVMFIDVKTLEPFSVTPFIGMKLPVKSPEGNDGLPGEPCYWTKDGKIKSSPYWVLVGGGQRVPTGPTFCPDCGRLVVSRNPVPGEGSTPPPTRAEWEASHSGHR